MIQLFREQEKQESIRHEIARFQRDKALKEVIETEEKSDDLKDINFLNKIKEESILASKLAHQVERRKAIEQQRFLESRIAEEAQNKKRESIRDEKLRQLLRENSPELRELQRKILEAKVSKERAVQKAYKLAAEELKREEEKKIAEDLAKEIEKEKLEVKTREMKEQMAKKIYHEALDNQRQLQASVNQEAYEETLRERKIIDDILVKMREEDLEADRKRIEEQKNYLQQIAECQRAKDEFDRIEQERRILEEAKHAHFRLAQEHREHEEQHRKLQEQACKEKIRETMVNRLEKIQEERDKYELLRTKLAIEEKELLDKDKEEIDLQKRARMKIESKEIYAMQMWIKHQREEQERKEEQLFRKKMMDELYKQDKLSLLTDQKKRQKHQEHRKLIQKMIEERRARLIEEKERDMADYRHQKEIEAERDLLVAKEKQRILSENAIELLGFLPKRILKDEEEIAQLGDQFKQFYQKNSETD